jgi:hypothetical protein
MSHPIPKRADFLNFEGDRDGEEACDLLLGKTLEEAEDIFDEFPAGACGAMMWMAPVAFCYYGEAAIRYLRGARYTVDALVLLGLADAFELRLDYPPNSPEVLDTMRRIVATVLENRERYEVDTERYGDLIARFEKLKVRIEAAGA